MHSATSHPTEVENLSFWKSKAADGRQFQKFKPPYLGNRLSYRNDTTLYPTKTWTLKF